MAEAELEADGEEETEELTARGNLVSVGEETDFDYAAGVLSVQEPACTISLIAIADMGGQLLVAVPEEAWAKKVKNRKLPVGALKKTVRVLVPPCSLEDRTAAGGPPTLNIWLGLLNTELEQHVLFDQALAMVHFPGQLDGSIGLPLASALVAVANGHFTFMTAESERPSAGIEARFAALEQGLEKITDALQLGHQPAAAAAPRVAPKKKEAAVSRAPRPSLPQGIDPVVAQQALQAGVSAQALEEMAAVVGARGGHVAQVGAPMAPAIPVDEDGDDVFDEDPAVFGGAGSADPIGTAVVQMSHILSRCTRRSRRRRTSLWKACWTRVGKLQHCSAWQVKSCHAEGAATHLDRKPKVVVSGRRTSYAAGLGKSRTFTRCFEWRSFGTWMAGAQEQSATVSIHGEDGMDGGWCFGCYAPGKARGMQSSSVPDPCGHRSDKLWIEEVGCLLQRQAWNRLRPSTALQVIVSQKVQRRLTRSSWTPDGASYSWLD